MKMRIKVEFSADEVRQVMIDCVAGKIGPAPEGMHYEAESDGYSTIQPVKVYTDENPVEKAVEPPPAPTEQVAP